MMRTALLTSLALAACAHKSQVKTTEPATPVRPAAAANVTSPDATHDTTPTPASPDLRVSRDLLAQCKVELGDRDRAPKFAFDAFELLPEDRDVLQQIADCVTRGPLEGHTLRLVGRADPRGTDEYNLSLGTRRAHTVATYLQSLGVRSAQLAETTRGAIDATGTDEAGWQTDRRVDLDLAD